MDVQLNKHDPTKYTDEELLKHCADSHDLLIRKAGERWAAARAELDEEREAWDLANGTANLAIQHRNAAEADLAAARSLLAEANQWLRDLDVARDLQDSIDAALAHQGEANDQA